ncbi:DUF4230 domain-containing protein [Gangjinia marincola]|uniref:DUF4230 domain-containing protein n=1 Tax=Gangjinia marincola TaxID=578463 RepID=A0ABP3XUU1_9FLAO
MRNILFGAVLALIIVFGLRYCEQQKDDREQLEESSVLIQEQIKNVGKLIVTEGYFSEVFTYKNSKELFGRYIHADKKALVVVNAKVTVSYDLSKIQTIVDEENKTLRILYIPEKELDINPDFNYYDVKQDYLNPFEASDYNTIKKKVEARLENKIEQSSIISNAENRLISELQKIYLLTNTMGWTLVYKQQPIQNLEEIKL